MPRCHQAAGPRFGAAPGGWRPGASDRRLGRLFGFVYYFGIVEQNQQTRRPYGHSKGRISMHSLTRRAALKAALATTSLIAAPYVRGAHAAGKLAIGFWDHWVPGANKTSEALTREWAEKEKVEVTIDYIPSQGDKNLMTIAAEAQARSGHDILALPTWWAQAYAKSLVPVNDIMEPLIKQNGAVNDTVTYLGKADGNWLAVPATIGSQIKGPCSR